jgi:hypothetical protein
MKARRQVHESVKNLPLKAQKPPIIKPFTTGMVVEIDHIGYRTPHCTKKNADLYIK